MILRTLCLIVLAAAVAPPQSSPPDLGYRLDTSWPQLPDGWNFKETPAVEVDTANYAYVFHRGEHTITEFDPAGKVVRAWGDGLFERPHSLRFDAEGDIWVVDDSGCTVLKMDRKGRIRMVLGRWRTTGETDSLFNRPTDVAFAPSGDIYVTDGYGNSRVVKYSKDGKFITAWGKKGAGQSEFVIPHAVAVDKQGRVYIGDRENRRIQIFDSNGKFLREWKHVGSPWGLYLPPDQSCTCAMAITDAF